MAFKNIHWVKISSEGAFIFASIGVINKAVTENLFEQHQKWCLVLQLAAEKKTPKLKKYLMQIRINFNPMRTISALDHIENIKVHIF